MRINHPKNVFLGYLKVNSLQNKFESLNELIKYIFLVSESKLDSSFPVGHILIPGYRMVRKDWNKKGWGVLFYINGDIPFKIIKCKKLPGNLEILTLKIILDKIKILLMWLYKATWFNEKDFLFYLSNACNFFWTAYENIRLIGDLNGISENKKLNDLCEMNKSEYLILKPSFKGLLPFTIDH